MCRWTFVQSRGWSFPVAACAHTRWRARGRLRIGSRPGAGAEGQIMRVRSAEMRRVAVTAIGVAIAASLVNSGREARSAEPNGWSTPPRSRSRQSGAEHAFRSRGFPQAREWSGSSLIGTPAGSGRARFLDPENDPAAYAAAFRHHFGLHPGALSQRRAADGPPREGVEPRRGRATWPSDRSACSVTAGRSGARATLGLGNTQFRP